MQQLRLTPGEVVSITGIDAVGAEVLVNLITAAVRPDLGDVRLFGTSTAAIDDYDAWLRMLDGLGLVTERAVLLAGCTVAQNLALPLTLEIEPIPADVRPRVDALADEVGIAAADRDRRVGDAPPGVVQRVRLGRALALTRACSSPSIRRRPCRARRWRPSPAIWRRSPPVATWASWP